MNILVLSHRVPFPPNKGEKIRSYHQLKHLRAQGHRLHVCAPYEDDSELHYFSGLEDDLGISTTKAKLGSKPLRLLSSFLRGKSLSVGNFYSKSLQEKIDQKIANERFDWILCTASSMAEYIFRSKSLPQENAPGLIMDFMDLDSDKWQQYAALKPFPISLIYRLEARRVARLENLTHAKFDACLLISQNEVDLFQQQTGTANKIHVVANGLDTDTFKPAPKPHPHPIRPVFIFTGVMDYFPNEDAVLWFCENIWPDLKTRYPNAEFYIAGMQPSPKIQALSELPGVHVTGFVDDILDYYHKADLFVAPFRVARGVQNKVLQAFACGLPVISTPIGAEGIACEHEKHLLVTNSEDENSFKEATYRLVENESLRDRLRNSAAQLIREQYSWSGRLALLDEILNSRTT